MKDRFAVSMFGQKRLSREGGIEIVVKELCTRMARDGCQVTCYNRSGHHVSGAEYDNKIEYDGIRQKFVPTIERKGLAAVKDVQLKNCQETSCIIRFWEIIILRQNCCTGLWNRRLSLL